MKNTFIIVFGILLASCGSQSTDKLTEMRKELSTKEKELAELKIEINKIKGEIEELDTTARDNAIAVMAMEVEKGAFKNPFEVQGLVESDQNVLISPEVPAKLLKLFVKEGQRVSKGQVIASLDGSTASSQIKELEGALTLAKINYEKQKRLWDQKIGSEMQFLQAKNQYENLQNSIATARTQLGKYSLRSPIAGTIDEIMANEGELVGSMTGGPVARVVNLKDIKIRADVSERYLGKIQAGQKVQVNLPSVGLEMTEKVASVSNVINPNNRTFAVYVKPTKNLNVLKPNLLAMITAYDYENAEAISVPTKLIRTDGENHFIYTIKTNGEKKTVEKRIIEVQEQFPGETVIASGLEVGDLVITEGVNSVVVGDEVKIIAE